MDKKEELLKSLREFSKEDNSINISEFRKQCKNEYFLLSHYFGNVDNAVSEAGLIKINKRNKELSLRDKLALEALMILRESYTLEQIGIKFGVTKVTIGKLYKVLDSQSKNSN